jgi:hypothetical protein
MGDSINNLPRPAATPTPTPARPAAAAPAPASVSPSTNNFVAQKQANQAAAQQSYAQQQQQAAAAAAAEQARIAALPRYLDFATGQTIVSPDQIAVQKAIADYEASKKPKSSGGGKYGAQPAPDPKGAPPPTPKGAAPPKPAPMSYADQLAQWNRNKLISEYYTSELDYRKRLAEETYKARMALPVLDDLGAYIQSQNLQVPTLYDPIHSPAWQRAMGQYLADLRSFRGAVFNPNYELPDSVGTAPVRPEGLTDEQWRQYTQGNYNAANFALLSRLGGSTANPGNNMKMAALQDASLGSNMLTGSRTTPRTFARPDFRLTNYTNPLTATSQTGNPIMDALMMANNPNFASPKLKQQYDQLMAEAKEINDAITNPFSVFVYGQRLPKDYTAPVRHQTVGPGGVKFGGEPGARALGATNGNPIPSGVEGAGLWAYGIDPRDPKSLYFAWDYAKNHMGPKGAFREYSQYLWPVSESGGNTSFGPDAYYRKVLDPNVAVGLLKKVDWHIRDTARKIDKSNSFMDTVVGQLLGAAITGWAGGYSPWLGAVFGAATGSQRGGGSALGALSGAIGGALGGVFNKFSPITRLSDVLPSYATIRPGMEQSFFGKVGDFVSSRITSLPSQLAEKYFGPNSFLTYANMGQQAFFDSLQNDLRRNNIPVQVSTDTNGRPTLVPNTNSQEYQQYLATNAAQETAPVQGARAGGLMSLRGANGVHRGGATYR